MTLNEAAAIPRRGSHGCYVHIEGRGSSVDRLRPVKCSRHHAPTSKPRTPDQIGPSGLLLEADCRRCGSHVVRTITTGNSYREAWTR